MNKHIKDINAELEKSFKIENTDAIYPEVIYEAVRYSLFSGGKRVRPILLLTVCEELGGDTKNALPFAAAIEMIHTYSLIHDDLPAIDNDDTRRNKPTNHVMYGEDIAILAGDALLNRAYEIMSQFCLENMTQHNLKAMAKLAKYAGIQGMIGGQVMDITLEIPKASLNDVKYIYDNKTAGLFKATFGCGALAAMADDEKVHKMEHIGYMLGFAFQLKDDELDIKSDTQKGKPTFFSLYEYKENQNKKRHDKVRKDVNFDYYFNNVKSGLQSLGKYHELESLIEKILNRKH